jgi:NitT/TauT family transport system substrate-binding protein
MKKFTIFLLILTILIGTVGCTAPEIEEKVDNKKLTIGVMPDMGAVPFVIAKEMGYYETHDLELDIQVFRSALDRDTALQTGNLDGAMTDFLTILFFSDADFDVRMTSSTYGNYMMVTTPSLTAEDLHGLDKISIGLSSNTVIDFTTEMIANSYGISHQLEKVAIPQMPVRLEMLGSGELSGATLPDPLASTAILNGGEKVSDTASFDLYPAIFMMNQSSINQNPDAIKSMYAAYNEAVDYLNSTDSTEYYDILVEKLGFPETLKDQIVFPTYEYANAPDEATFAITQAWMQENELVTNSFSYDDLNTTDYIK